MKKMLSILLALSMVFGVAVTAVAEAPREAELNIMMSFPQYMAQWEAYCRQFEEKMLAEENTKVKINLEMPSSDQYESILQARLSGGDAPDLFTLHRNNIGVYDKAGYLYDLSSQPLAGMTWSRQASPLRSRKSEATPSLKAPDRPASIRPGTLASSSSVFSLASRPAGS